MQSFPIFVINLPTKTERRLAIERQLIALGAQFEIVEGVFGNDARVTARYDDALAIKEHGESFATGEKGCALAHALVYERMVNERIPLALILEDDIVLPTDFLERAEAEATKANRKWHWLSFDYRYVGWPFLKNWLGATLKTIRQRPSFIFYATLKMFYIPPLALLEGARNSLANSSRTYSGSKRFYRPLYNAGAYFITLEGAELLLPLTKPLRFTADEVQNVARRRVGFRLYGYVPLIVHQNTTDFETDAGKTNEAWESIFKASEGA